MDATTFLDNFGHIADAPNGVNKLRDLILELALQGKLGTHNKNDEPAIELLNNIELERTERQKKERIKYPAVSEISIEEQPYELAPRWVWARLGEIIKISSGDGLTSKNMAENGHIPVFGGNGINGYHDSWNVEKPTLVIGRVGFYCGSVHLTPEKAWVTDNAFITEYSEADLYREFLYWLLKGTNLKEKDSATAQPVISGRKVYPIVVGIPPREEQKRIVAKVDQLMALCDQLETQQKQKVQTRVALNNAALDKLLTAQNPDEFNHHWQRIDINFHLLYDNLENLSKIRAAILQLSIQGKLVKQDGKDTPVTTTIEQIQRLKETLIENGEIKKGKDFPKITNTELPFSIPDEWKWIRLGDMAEVITKGSSPKWQGVSYVDEGKGVLFVTSENVGNYVVDHTKRKYVEPKFNEIEPRSILRRNDILMNIVGASIGRTAIYESDELANINQAVCLIRVIKPNELVTLRYLLYFMNSDACISYMFDKQVDNARANLSMGNIAKFAIPLPPLEEQKRIVDKVDQLMALCDQLETKLKQTHTTSGNLVEATVRSLVAA